MLFYTEKSLNYRQILSSVFRGRSFCSMRAAVEFLLNKVPLTSVLVKKDSYRTSFPFTVETPAAFASLTAIKKHSYEWLRAKMINKLITRKYRNRDACPDADLIVDGTTTEDDDSIWTTKEILTFSRRHGYIPYSLKSPTNNVKSSTEEESEETTTAPRTSELKNIIKNEINRVRQQKVTTITHNHEIYDWINRFVDHQLSTVKDEAPINVIDDGDDQDQKTNRLGSLSSQTTIVSDEKKQLWLPLPASLEKETQFVTDICDEIGIRLQPEELIEGVIFPAAHRCLVHVAQHFVEDVIRESHAIKWDDQRLVKTLTLCVLFLV